jgi:hypothetical protein
VNDKQQALKFQEVADYLREEESGRLRGAMRMDGAAISAAVANRTHRVVRERAQEMRARRSKVRSLWVPLAVCASLLVAICFAIWSVLDQYEVAPTGVPDASQQLLVLSMWSLPLSAALLTMALLRRGRNQTGDEGDSEGAR